MKLTTASTLLTVAALATPALGAMTLSIAGNAAVPQHIGRRYLSSRSTITESIGNNITGGSYIANVSVGTPPQNVQLVIDTGSSDVWLLDVSADLCTNTTDQAEEDSGCQTPCKLSIPQLPKRVNLLI